MTQILLSTLVFIGTSALCGSADFQSPVRLTVGETAIRVESPGYAAPCWADMDGDGKKDLIVGQFNQGKIRIFKNLGAGKFGAGDWLEAGGKVAEVPGVW
jgi:FG-GAP-like repeat